jgi:hypothetical protein
MALGRIIIYFRWILDKIRIACAMVFFVSMTCVFTQRRHHTCMCTLVSFYLGKYAWWTKIWIWLVPFNGRQLGNQAPHTRYDPITPDWRGGTTELKRTRIENDLILSLITVAPDSQDFTTCLPTIDPPRNSARYIPGPPSHAQRLPRAATRVGSSGNNDI